DVRRHRVALLVRRAERTTQRARRDSGDVPSGDGRGLCVGYGLAIVPTEAVELHGMRDLQRAFRRAEPAARKKVRSAFAGAAVPVARDAEGLARSSITRIGEKWPQMRVGVTQRSVYVAPKQRGARRADDPRKRPNLAPLLMGRAMEPALAQNANEIEHAAERALDRIADEF